MKKIIFLIFLFIVSICYSKNEVALKIEPNDSLKVIKKMTKNYEDGVFQNEELIVFTYEDNLISKISTTQNGNFLEEVGVKYENGKLKQMNLLYTTLRNSKNNLINPPKENLNVIYNYNDDNLITSLSNESNGLKYIHSFTYNDAKQLIKEVESKDGIMLREKKYNYDKNGNISKEKNIAMGEYDYYKSYDDKNNPFSLIYPDAYLKIYKISKNNIKSYRMSNNSYTSTHTYEYEYNSNNYPTKIIQKNGRKIESETIIEYSTIQ